jgi:hypothetical protein
MEMKQTVTVRNHLYPSDQLNLGTLDSASHQINGTIRIIRVVWAIPRVKFHLFSISYVDWGVGRFWGLS